MADLRSAIAPLSNSIVVRAAVEPGMKRMRLPEPTEVSGTLWTTSGVTSRISVPLVVSTKIWSFMIITSILR
jgi:hypothetical protein